MIALLLTLALDTPPEPPPPAVETQPRRSLLPAELEALALALPDYPEGAEGARFCDVELSGGALGAAQDVEVKTCPEPFASATRAAAAAWVLPECPQGLCHYALSLKLAPEGASWATPATQVHWSEVTIKRRVTPKYPEHMRDQDVEGLCKVRFFIDAKGEPYKLEIEDCTPGFEDSALDACAKWRFYPYKREGVAVPAQFVLSIKYRLA